jgi:hypothetical protein
MRGGKQSFSTPKSFASRPKGQGKASQKKQASQAVKVHPLAMSGSVRHKTVVHALPMALNIALMLYFNRLVGEEHRGWREKVRHSSSLWEAAATVASVQLQRACNE